MKLTQKQLNAWNIRQYKTFGISANENVNVRDGLPAACVRRLLRRVHGDKYGICTPNGKLTMKDVRDWVALWPKEADAILNETTQKA
jgi:hypothetical protein